MNVYICIAPYDSMQKLEKRDIFNTSTTTKICLRKLQKL